MSNIVYVLALLTYTAHGTHGITHSTELAYTLSSSDCIMERNRQQAAGIREGHNQSYFCMRVDDPVIRDILIYERAPVVYMGSAARNGDVIVYGDVIINNY